jgi:hypothetical protein
MGEIWEKWFFFGEGGIPDPPEVVSFFWGGGGGGPLACGADKCPWVVFRKQLIGPPMS